MTFMPGSAGSAHGRVRRSGPLEGPRAGLSPPSRSLRGRAYYSRSAPVVACSIAHVARGFNGGGNRTKTDMAAPVLVASIDLVQWLINRLAHGLLDLMDESARIVGGLETSTHG